MFEKPKHNIFSSLDSEISLVTVQRKVIKQDQSFQKKVVTEKKNIKESDFAQKSVEKEESILNEDTVSEDIKGDNPVENINENVEANEKLTASYKSYALSKIASRKTYPIAARAKSEEGKVKLRVIINSEGELILCEIVSACNYDILNEAAVNAVTKSAPFKKMKGLSSVELTFTMDFSLTD